MLEAEAALPIAGSAQPCGRIERRHESAFRALVALHRGSHEQLPRVHRALCTAIPEQASHRSASRVRLSDPAGVGDPDHHLTEVV